jgi:hypothetical protein
MTPPKLQPLAFLLGTWRGTVDVTYPTMEPASFTEEMAFEDGGAGEEFPFIAYRERAWTESTGLTEHSERGFWRVDGSVVDATLSHPIAVSEISEGILEGTMITLESKTMGVATTGLPVTSLTRRYEVEGDHMSYIVDMQTPETPLTLHLTGSLTRAPASS